MFLLAVVSTSVHLTLSAGGWLQVQYGFSRKVSRTSLQWILWHSVLQASEVLPHFMLSQCLKLTFPVSVKSSVKASDIRWHVTGRIVVAGTGGSVPQLCVAPVWTAACLCGRATCGAGCGNPNMSSRWVHTTSTTVICQSWALKQGTQNCECSSTETQHCVQCVSLNIQVFCDIAVCCQVCSWWCWLTKIAVPWLWGQAIQQTGRCYDYKI